MSYSSQRWCDKRNDWHVLRFTHKLFDQHIDASRNARPHFVAWVIPPAREKDDGSGESSARVWEFIQKAEYGLNLFTCFS